MSRSILLDTLKTKHPCPFMLREYRASRTISEVCCCCLIFPKLPVSDQSMVTSSKAA